MTVQQLANLCMYSWEAQRELGFHMQDAEAFRKHLTEMPLKDLQMLMENLGLLFSTVRDISETKVGLLAVQPALTEAPKIPPVVLPTDVDL